jgi:hypothetical protein
MVNFFCAAVATRPHEQRMNWLCEQTFNFKLYVCSSLWRTHILGKFDYESVKAAKHDDAEVYEGCVPNKMKFRDNEVPQLDIRVDVRMFKCPIRFKVADEQPVSPLGDEMIRDFFITGGSANQTIALLLTSADKNHKSNICVEDIFWFNDTSISANASDEKSN